MSKTERLAREAVSDATRIPELLECPLFLNELLVNPSFFDLQPFLRYPNPNRCRIDRFNGLDEPLD